MPRYPSEDAAHRQFNEAERAALLASIPPTGQLTPYHVRLAVLLYLEGKTLAKLKEIFGRDLHHTITRHTSPAQRWVHNQDRKNITRG